MVVKGRIDIGGVTYQSLSIVVTEKINEPATFEAVLDGKQGLSLDALVEIYREVVGGSSTKFFKGILEKRGYQAVESDVLTTVKGRSDFGKLAYKVQTPTTWTDQTITAVITAILTGTGIGVGSITSPYPVYRRWFQTTDTEFNSDVLTNVTVEGTGNAAKVILISGQTTGNLKGVLISPSNLVKWDKFDATRTTPNLITFDILDSSDVIIVSNVTLPYDMSSITQTSLKVRANFTEAIWLNQTLWYGYYLIYSTYSRRGQWLPASNKRITKVTFRLAKIGSPTGTAYVRVRNKNSDAIIAETSFDVSTLSPTATDYTYNLTFLHDVDVRILVEYTGGSSTVGVGIYYHNADVITGGRSDYTTGYTDYTVDVYIKVYEGPELLDWVVWYKADSITFTIDYMSKAQLIMDLAGWIDGEFQTTVAGTLDFKTELGSDRSGTITLNESNSRIASFTRDGSLQTDKIYGIGSGTQGVDRIEVAEGTGTKESVYVDKDATTEEFIRSIAKKILDARINPIENLEVELAEADGWGLNLGDTVKVNYPSLDINNVNYRIVQLERRCTDVGDEQVRLVLANYYYSLLEREMLKLLKHESWLK